MPIAGLKYKTNEWDGLGNGLHRGQVKRQMETMRGYGTLSELEKGRR